MDWIVERGLVRIPDHVPFEQALWIEPVNTCYKAIHNLHLAADETVLVIGQGPIGILLASLARQTGATVLTSDLYPSRHEVAVAIRSASSDLCRQTKSDCSGERAYRRPRRGCSDCGCRRQRFDSPSHGCRAISAVACCCLQQRSTVKSIIDPAAICMDEKSLIGSYSSSADVQHNASQLVSGWLSRSISI